MFRLIIALGLAAVLLPAETIREKSANQKTVPTAEITTYDTFSAAHSIYSDISSFCERNVETCITGKALAQSAMMTVRGTLSKFTDQQDAGNSSTEVDQIKTSSIQK